MWKHSPLGMLFFVPCLSTSEMLYVCVCVHSYVHTDDIKIITYRRLERNVCVETGKFMDTVSVC